MGFFDSILSLFGGTTSSDVQKNWEENLTLEQIEDMEKQGCDMTEYRKRFEERIAREKAAKEAYLAMLDYAKLEQYQATPRPTDGEFVNKVISENRLSEKKRTEISNAQLVYGAVVQAHGDLWKSGDGGMMGMVVVFALDQHAYDADWLNNVANKISDMKESPQVPDDCKKFIKTLRDDQSIFCFKLGSSLVGNANAWCATYAVEKQSLLPDKRLEEDCVLPFVLLEEPKENRVASLELIPAVLYTK